jgi:hypothetical protein
MRWCELCRFVQRDRKLDTTEGRSEERPCSMGRIAPDRSIRSALLSEAVSANFHHPASNILNAGLTSHSATSDPSQGALKCARQLVLSWDFFAARQVTIRSVFGMAKAHKLIASPMQSARCAAVGLNAAKAVLDRKHARQPATAAPRSVVRSFVMTVSLALVAARRADQVDAATCYAGTNRAVTCVTS